LTQASLHIGAVYLDQSQPVSGAQATGCYLTGTYVAQETSALDVDLLSAAPQLFPAPAHGVTTPPARVGQVWLGRGYITDVPGSTPVQPVLALAGTALQAGSGAAFPFTAAITIESNHQNAGSGLAGGDPICKERIVTPIPAAVTIERTGGLLLRVDPCRLFTNVDFSLLPPGAAAGSYQFSDDPAAAAYSPTGRNLYNNLRNYGSYAFSWTADL
jgi:hypothetical protein